MCDSVVGVCVWGGDEGKGAPEVCDTVVGGVCVGGVRERGRLKCV